MATSDSGVPAGVLAGLAPMRRLAWLAATPRPDMPAEAVQTQDGWEKEDTGQTVTMTSLQQAWDDMQQAIPRLKGVVLKERITCAWHCN